MRSKISFFNKGLFFANLKRFSWAAILETIVLFFCFPMNLMTMYTDAMWLENAVDILERRQEYTLFSNLTICVYAVVIAVLLFSYLHKPKMTTALHGLPLSRTTLFGSTVMSGLVLLWMPIAVNLLAIFITKYTMEVGVWIVWASVLRWVLYAALLSLTLFAFTTLIGMFVGHAAAQFVFTYILHFLPLALFAAFMALCQIFLYGFNSSLDIPQWMLELPMMTIAHDFTMPCRYYVFLFAVEGAVLLALAWLAYKKRPLEQAGDVVVFEWLKPVFKYGLSLCAAICGFLYVAGVSGLETNGNIVINTVVAVLWAAVGFCIAQMLIAKTWRIFGTYKEMLLTCLVIAAIFVGFQSDVVGFEKRTVAPEDVAYVELDGFYEFANGGIRIEEPENIRLVTQLHKYAIEQGKDFQGNGYNVYISIEYHLKNGNVIKRAYNMTENEWLISIYNALEAKKSGYPMLYEKLGAVLWIHLRAEGQDYSMHKDPELIAALRKDVESQTYNVILDARYGWDAITVHEKMADVEEMPQKSFSLEFEVLESDGDITRGEARNYTRYYYIDIVESTMPNTYAVLEQMLPALSYEPSFEDIDMHADSF